MTRIEQVTKSIRNIEDLPSDDVHTALLAEIALSLAVIVDRLKDINNGREKEVESICDSLDDINHTIFTTG